MKKLILMCSFGLLGTFALANANGTDKFEETLLVDPCGELMVGVYETMIALGFNEDAACTTSEIVGILCDSFGG